MIEQELKDATATNELELLARQAKNLRDEITNLHRDKTVAEVSLAATKRDLAATELGLVRARQELATAATALAQTTHAGLEPTVQLREANEHLVLAALHAESLADIAVDDLHQMVIAIEQEGSTHTPDHASTFENLREANARLVIAALSAQELESRAQAAYNQQLKLTATVAHELRNPLSPIRNAVRLLVDARTDTSMHTKLHDIIKRQVIHMSRLVEDLLEGSRLHTGKFQLVCVEISLVDILHDTIEAAQHAMDAKHQKFQFIRPTEKVTLYADPLRLTQVFRNLLDNASKYTPNGGEISLAVNTLDKEVMITITDNGVGISEAALPHVFDLFVQDTQGTHSNNGLGIGLSVVRDLVDAHHGRVTAESAGRGCGSKLTVILPLCVKPKSATA